MQRFRIGDANANVPGLKDEDKHKIEKLFRDVREEDGEKRHKMWLQHISNGYFSFLPVNLTYIAKGVGSWKYEALGTTKETDDKHDKYGYSPMFLKSNWKLFHDALQAHRFYVIHDLLPQYGICAA